MVISTFGLKKPSLLSDMNFMHKEILKMFQCNRAYQNILYMVMDRHIIVQSDTAPQSIPDSLQLMHTGCVDAELLRIQNGNVVKIYAVFEPTKKGQKINGNWESNIIIRDEKDRKEWIKRKFQAAGNILAVNEVSKCDYRVSNHTGMMRRTSFYSYEMLVHVTNANELRQILKRGIGRSKSYGAGMCMVIGVQSV